MCWYASKNGFNGYRNGTTTVSWSFPGLRRWSDRCLPRTLVRYPYLKVTVSQPLKMYFSTLLTGNRRSKWERRQPAD